MSENKFDEHIKKKLQGHEQDYDPASWELLYERLDQDIDLEDEDAQFDQELADKIASHRSMPNHQDWLLMKEELEILQERKEKVIVAKFVEVVVLLLLILTFNNYRSLTFPKDRVNQEYAQSIRQLNNDASSIQASAELDLILEHQLVEKFDSNSKNLLKDNISNEKIPTIEFTINYPFSIESTIKNLNLPIAAIHEKVSYDWSNKFNKVPQRKIKFLSINIELPILEVSPIFAFEKRKKNMDGWSIGIPLSIDANFVNTDLNFNILRSQVRYGLSGASIGINAAYRKKGLELETGIEYSVKKFAPGLIRNYKNITATSNTLLQDQLELVTFKQFQIPLLLKAYVSPQERISFYGTIGVAANFLLDTQYDLSRQTISANLRPSSAIDQKEFDLSEPPKGLLQGGTIQDNLYVTGVIGFGVQHYLPNGLGWYIQPQYQHSLTKNINEVASEVNSLSLELGIKYKL